jgi:hypothetical protein
MARFSVAFAALAALLVTSSAYNTSVSLMERYDVDSSAKLNETEVSLTKLWFMPACKVCALPCSTVCGVPTTLQIANMLAVLLDDHRDHCPNASSLISLSDTNADEELDASEAQTMAYTLLPCLEEYTCGHSAALTVTLPVSVLTGNGAESHVLSWTWLGLLHVVSSPMSSMLSFLSPVLNSVRRPNRMCLRAWRPVSIMTMRRASTSMSTMTK